MAYKTRTVVEPAGFIEVLSKHQDFDGELCLLRSMLHVTAVLKKLSGSLPVVLRLCALLEYGDD